MMIGKDTDMERNPKPDTGRHWALRFHGEIATASVTRQQMLEEAPISI
jgi:hypothetical protein